MTVARTLASGLKPQPRQPAGSRLRCRLRHSARLYRARCPASRLHRLHALSVAYLPAYQSPLIGFADQSAVLLPVKNYPELSALGVAELEGLAIGYGGPALCLDARGSVRLDRRAGVGPPVADGPGSDGDSCAQRCDAGGPRMAFCQATPRRHCSSRNPSRASCWWTVCGWRG